MRPEVLVIGGLVGLALAKKALGTPATQGPPPPPILPPSQGKTSMSFAPGSSTASWFASLPAGPGPAREKAIFDAVNRGFTRSIDSTQLRSQATIDGQV